MGEPKEKKMDEAYGDEPVKPEVTPQFLAEQAEIKRLSEEAEKIAPRAGRTMPFEVGDNAGYKLGFPYSRGA